MVVKSTDVGTGTGTCIRLLGERQVGRKRAKTERKLVRELVGKEFVLFFEIKAIELCRSVSYKRKRNKEN